jgi:hypothetical protein
MNTTKKAPTLDPRLVAAIARRQSGAAGQHGDRRSKRLRTRSAQKRAALKDW